MYHIKGMSNLLIQSNLSFTRLTFLFVYLCFMIRRTKCSVSSIVISGKDAASMLYTKNPMMFLENSFKGIPSTIIEPYNDLIKAKKSPVYSMCLTILNLTLNLMHYDLSRDNVIIELKDISSFAEKYGINLEQLNKEEIPFELKCFALQYILEMKHPLDIRRLITQRLNEVTKIREEILKKIITLKTKGLSNLYILEWEDLDSGKMKNKVLALKQRIKIEMQNLVFYSVYVIRETVLYRLFSNFDQGHYNVCEILTDLFDTNIFDKPEDSLCLNDASISAINETQYKARSIYVCQSIRFCFTEKLGNEAVNLLIGNIEAVLDETIWAALDNSNNAQLKFFINGKDAIKNKQSISKYMGLIESQILPNSIASIENKILEYQKKKINLNIMYKSYEYNKCIENRRNLLRKDYFSRKVLACAKDTLEITRITYKNEENIKYIYNDKTLVFVLLQNINEYIF